MPLGLPSYRLFVFFFLLSGLLPSNALASLSIWGFDDIPTIKEKPQNLDVTDQAISSLTEEVDDLENAPPEVKIKAVEGNIVNESLSPILNEVSDSPKPQVSTSQPPPESSYDIPILPDNEHVRKYIALFKTRLRPDFEKWLSRSGRYIDMIQKTLRENNLPEDLVYLALIESGFNVKAYSRSRAVGVWQFMKGTGKRYGLRIDRWIDERRDPVKSTQAATRYLTELYDMFGSWPLALAAYNAGEGRIYKTIVRIRTRDFWKLRKSRHLRPETRNYVPKFMAATIIAKNPERYQFSVEYKPPWNYDEVEIPHATYLSAIARYAGISLKTLKKYNPELKQNVTPPRAPGYKIKLPPGKKDTFLAAYSPEKEEQIFVGRSFKHRVRRGETVSSIAHRYGISINDLLKTNKLRSRSIIRVGQNIMIHESPTRAGDKHVIQRGESISTIASSYRVSMRRLLEANDLHRKSVIRAGHTLIIPDRAGKRRTSSPRKTVQRDRRKHQIRSGESISIIAQKYAVRLKDLLRANQLTKKSVIHAGNTLIIP